MPVLPEWSSLGLFAVAALVLLLTPGPAVLYIVTRSIDQGRRAGLVSVLGVHVGTLAHIFAAAAGLSALLAASATAFGVVKDLGAAYLIYIGVRRLRDRASIAAPEAGKPRALRRAFLDGVVVNVLNPKTALFFLAFLPQFVTEGRGHVGGQVIALGVVFVLLGAVTDSLYALSAGSAARWLRGRPRFLAGERWISGGLYCRLGGALEQPPDVAAADPAPTVGAATRAVTRTEAVVVVRARNLRLVARVVLRSARRVENSTYTLPSEPQNGARRRIDAGPAGDFHARNGGPPGRAPRSR